ncbi:MAG: hypothetical protein ACFBQW_00715 [Sphingomonadaceae bacterium]
MRILLIAAALSMGSAALAQGTDPNAPGVPPGDGVTQLGNTPDGQPYTPPGFNQGINAYPPAPAQMPAEYPPCSADRANADRCVQTYERGVRPRG